MVVKERRGAESVPESSFVYNYHVLYSVLPDCV